MPRLPQGDNASIELSAFFHAYFSLIEVQMQFVRTKISEAYGEIFKHLNTLSEDADKKKLLATTILVRREKIPAGGIEKSRGEDTYFSATTFGADARESGTGNPARTTIQNVPDWREAIIGMESVDTAVRDLVFKMIGALSADDVVSQRLAHVQHGLRLLGGAFRQAGGEKQGAIESDSIAGLSERIESELSKTYTTTDESRIHKKHFSQAK